MCPIALNYSIDGGRRHIWQDNVLVQVISFLAEVICVDWQVIVDRFIDAGVRAIVVAFYHVDEAWVMCEMLAVFSGV